MGPASVLNTLACPTLVGVEVLGTSGIRMLPWKLAAQDLPGLWRQQHNSFGLRLAHHVEAKVFLCEVKAQGGEL